MTRAGVRVPGVPAVELRGFEPRTFSMRTRRATNCATAPGEVLKGNGLAVMLGPPARRQSGSRLRPGVMPFVKQGPVPPGGATGI
jgi:hypothetical protein